jgi:hypothetical protein
MTTHVILSLKHSGGDFLTWWGPNRCGYTHSLQQAGHYSAWEAGKIEASCHDGHRSSVAIHSDLAHLLAHSVVDLTERNLRLLGTDLDELHKANAP